MVDVQGTHIKIEWYEAYFHCSYDIIYSLPTCVKEPDRSTNIVNQNQSTVPSKLLFQPETWRSLTELVMKSLLFFLTKNSTVKYIRVFNHFSQT